MVLGLLVGCGRTSLEGSQLNDMGASDSPSGGATDGGQSSKGGSVTTAASATGGVANGGIASGGIANGGIASGGFAGGGITMGGASGPMDSGGANAGEPGMQCQLAPGDCAVPGDTGCEMHAPCTGGLIAHHEPESREAYVMDVTTAPDGRIAIAGAYRGSIDFGGESQPLVSADAAGSGTSDAFVALLDPLGDAQWAYAYGAAGSQVASGVDFGRDGEVVAQGAWPENPFGEAPGAFAVRLAWNGDQVWSALGNGAKLSPSRVRSSEGTAMLFAGTYQREASFLGAEFGPSLSAGYLIKVENSGLLLWSRSVVPETWKFASLGNAAVDEQGGVLVVGQGQRGDGNFSAFLQKRSRDGEVVFTKELFATGGISLTALAVDRRSHVVVAGRFSGKLESAGEAFQSSSASASDVWLAHYTGEGELEWQKVYSSLTKSADARGAAMDPFGNVIVVGAAQRLQVDGAVLDAAPAHQALYVLKLRPDGSTVWLRSFRGDTSFDAVASDRVGRIWIGGSYLDRLQLDDDVVETEQGGRHPFLLELAP